MTTTISSRLLLLSSVLLLAACGEKNTFAPPPPTPVGVQPPVVRDQQTYTEHSGRIEALQIVDLRARVKGILKTVSPDFHPGMKVAAGTLLFEIDDVPYIAARDTARAALAKAKADLRIANITLDRRTKAGQAVSEIEKEAAQADVDAAAALVMAAEADLTNAEENLSYCKISAPIAGRISELQVDQFNLVGNNEATLLCTIVQDDSMHVYFEINERVSIRLLNRRKGFEDDNSTPPKATLTLADGSPYEHEAQIELADNRIDPATGTLRVRAVVPNPDGKLADGLFVRVKVPRPETNTNAILVPTIALQQDLGGYFALTVDENNKVVRKNVNLGDRVGRFRIITSGLTGEESIITDGLQRVREGASVAPSPAPPVDPPPVGDTPPPAAGTPADAGNTGDTAAPAPTPGPTAE